MGKVLQFRRTKQEVDDIVTQDKDNHFAVLDLTSIQATRPDAVLVDINLNVQTGIVMFNFMKKREDGDDPGSPKKV